MATTTIPHNATENENWDDDFDFPAAARSRQSTASKENWDADFESESSPTSPAMKVAPRFPIHEPEDDDDEDNWDDSFSYSPPVTPAKERPTPKAKRQDHVHDDDLDAEFGVTEEDSDDSDEDKTVTRRRVERGQLEVSPPPPVPTLPAAYRQGSSHDLLPPSPRQSLFTPSILSHGSSGHDSTTHLFASSVSGGKLSKLPPSPPLHKTRSDRERRRLRKKSRPGPPDTVFELQPTNSTMPSMGEVSSSDAFADTDDNEPAGPSGLDAFPQPARVLVTPEPYQQPISVPHTPSRSNLNTPSATPAKESGAGALLSRGLGSVKRKLGRASKKRVSSTPSEVALAENEVGVVNDLEPDLEAHLQATSSSPPLSSSPPSNRPSWFFRGNSSFSPSTSPPSHSASTTPPNAQSGRNDGHEDSPAKLIKRKSFGFVPIRRGRGPINHHDNGSLNDLPGGAGDQSQSQESSVDGHTSLPPPPEQQPSGGGGRRYGGLGLGWSPHKSRSSSRTRSRQVSSATANGSVDDLPRTPSKRQTKSRTVSAQNGDRSQSRASRDVREEEEHEEEGFFRRSVRRISMTSRPHHTRKDSNVSTRSRTPSLFRRAKKEEGEEGGDKDGKGRSSSTSRPSSRLSYKGRVRSPRTPERAQNNGGGVGAGSLRRRRQESSQDADDELRGDGAGNRSSTASSSGAPVSSSDSYGAGESDSDSESDRDGSGEARGGRVRDERTMRAKHPSSPSPGATPRKSIRTKRRRASSGGRTIVPTGDNMGSPPPPLPGLPKGAAPPSIPSSSSSATAAPSIITPASPAESAMKTSASEPAPSSTGGGASGGAFLASPQVTSSGGSLGRSSTATPRPRAPPNTTAEAGARSATPNATGRRNSLGDLRIGAEESGKGGGGLRIPARISAAQSGLRRDLGMVKEFAGEVERLKTLQKTYQELTNKVQEILDGYMTSVRAMSPPPSSSTGRRSRSGTIQDREPERLPTIPHTPPPPLTPTSPTSSKEDQPRPSISSVSSAAGDCKQLASSFYTINSKYKVTWECAELLIELGGGSSSASSAGGGGSGSQPASSPTSPIVDSNPALVGNSTSAPSGFGSTSGPPPPWGRERAITLSGDGSRSPSPAIQLAQQQQHPSSSSSSSPTPAVATSSSSSASASGTGVGQAGWRASTGRHDLSARQLALLKEILASPTPPSLTSSSSSSSAAVSKDAVIPPPLPSASSTSSSSHPYNGDRDERSTSALSFVVNRDWRWGAGNGTTSPIPNASGILNPMASTITLPGSSESGPQTGGLMPVASRDGAGNGGGKVKRSSKLLGMSGFRDMLKALKKSSHSSSSKSGSGVSLETGGGLTDESDLDARGLPKDKEGKRSVSRQGGGTGGRRRAKTSSGLPGPWDSVRSFQQRPTSPFDSSSSFAKSTTKSPRRPSLASIFRIGNSHSGSSAEKAAAAARSASKEDSDEEEDWDRMDDAVVAAGGGSGTIRGRTTSPYLQDPWSSSHPHQLSQQQRSSQQDLPSSAVGSRTSLVSSAYEPPLQRSTKLSNVQELDIGDEKTPTKRREKRPGSAHVSSSAASSRRPSPPRSTSYSSNIPHTSGGGGKTGSVRSMPPGGPGGAGVAGDILAMTPENIKPLLVNAKEVSRRLVECLGEIKGLLEEPVAV